DVGTQGFDGAVLGARLRGAAAQAGAKSGVHGLVGAAEELDVLALGLAGATRQSAEHAGGSDADEEEPVERGIAAEERGEQSVGVTVRIQRCARVLHDVTLHDPTDGCRRKTSNDFGLASGGAARTVDGEVVDGAQRGEPRARWER